MEMAKFPSLNLFDSPPHCWWNSFSWIGNVLEEARFMYLIGFMAPCEFFDITTIISFSGMLQSLYPVVPIWWSIHWFPEEVLFPLSPMVYHFYDTLRAERKGKDTFFESLIRKAYGLLYASV